jgi:hypothetical protein
VGVLSDSFFVSGLCSVVDVVIVPSRYFSIILLPVGGKGEQLGEREREEEEDRQRGRMRSDSPTVSMRLASRAYVVVAGLYAMQLLQIS